MAGVVTTSWPISGGGADPMPADMVQQMADEDNPLIPLTTPSPVSAVPAAGSALGSSSFCVAWAALHAVVFLSGCVANLLLIATVARGCRRHLHTVTNCFLCGLASNYIVMCTVTGPLGHVNAYVTHGWYFGPWLCHLFPAVETATLSVAVLTITSLTLERFFALCCPGAPRVNVKHALRFNLVIWLFAYGSAIPYGMYMNRTLQEPGMPVRCVDDWSVRGRRTVGLFAVVIQNIIPLLICVISNMAVWWKLHDPAAATRLTDSLPCRGAGCEGSSWHEEERRRTVMIMGMAVLFALCWLPLTVLDLLGAHFPPAVESRSDGWDGFLFFFFTGHLLAVSSAVWVPLLVIVMERRFRRQLEYMLLRNRLCSSSASGARETDPGTPQDTAMSKDPCGMPAGQINMAYDMRGGAADVDSPSRHADVYCLPTRDPTPNPLVVDRLDDCTAALLD